MTSVWYLTKILVATVDSTKSTSFKLAADGEDKFIARFGGGMNVTGDFITETIQIGDVKLDNAILGLGKATDIPFGVLGIGYAELEEIVNREGEQSKYDNLPVALAKSGLISSVAFSLWLNDHSKINLSILCLSVILNTE
jgi:elongation factor G